MQAAIGCACQQAACHKIVIESRCSPRNSIENESHRHKWRARSVQRSRVTPGSHQTGSLNVTSTFQTELLSSRTHSIKTMPPMFPCQPRINDDGFVRSRRVISRCDKRDSSVHAECGKAPAGVQQNAQTSRPHIVRNILELSAVGTSGPRKQCDSWSGISVGCSSRRPEAHARSASTTRNAARLTLDVTIAEALDRNLTLTWLVMRGASLRAVAELLGHQTM